LRQRLAVIRAAAHGCARAKDLNQRAARRRRSVRLIPTRTGPVNDGSPGIGRAMMIHRNPRPYRRDRTNQTRAAGSASQRIALVNKQFRTLETLP